VLLETLEERWPLPGRQRSTASMEARQGWICSGMLKVTRATIAALAIVDAIDGGSEGVSGVMGEEEVGKPLTHADNVALNGVAEGKITGNGDQDVDGRRGPNAGANDTDNAARRIVLDLIHD